MVNGPIEEILKLPGNSVTVNYLFDGLRQRKVVPVAGPMTSKDAGYPTYAEFVQQTAGLAGVEASDDTLKTATAIVSVLGRMAFLDLLEDAMRTRPGSSGSCLHQLIRLDAPHVVTMNLDMGLDEAAVAQKKEYVRLVGNSRLISPRSLHKVFGDVSDRESLIATDDEYSRAYMGKWPVMLAGRGSEYSLFLAGHIPGPEFVLDWIQFPGSPQQQVHYAAVPNPSDRAAAVRFYASRSVRPIWLPDAEPAWLRTLLAYLAEQVLGPEKVVINLHFPKSPQPALPPAVPPVDLLQQCRAGECVAVVGSGISARAGIPTWAALLAGMVDVAEQHGLLQHGDAEIQRSALRDNAVNAVADSLAGTIADKKLVLDYLQSASTSTQPLPKAHDQLRGIPFSALITTNYDNLLDGVMGTDVVYTPEQAEQLLVAHNQRKRYLLKLYGSPWAPDSVVYSPAEYQARVGRNPLFLQFMEGLFFSRTLLFLGMSLNGITDFVSAMPSRGSLPQKHYALVAVSGTSWRVHADTLQRRYGVEVIPYTISDEHPEVDTFLEALRAGTAEAPKAAPQMEASRLRKMILKNVGPFENLELDLSGHWSVLLGDNGVGKSSILKALAIAIAGSDARPWAGRVVRAGQTAASIHIVTDKNPQGYVTEIYRKDAESDVISLPSRCLEAEGWVALGFPPLRTVSWQASEGPQTMGKFRPSVEDVLPLVRGEADPRMDKLKQWIVNLDSSDKAERLQGKADTRPARTLVKFFEIVTRLTDGLQVSFQEVTSNYQVLVKTPDGGLPIEALSQGMTSLFSWVGILLERLFEVNGSAEDPSQSHAVVLMDEIDAHMHPAWQQVLVHRLRSIFPNVQFIVSTHSPLIIAGMASNEVVRFRRDASGRPVAAPIEEEMTKGRADQILTGELFSLPTTLPPRTTDLILEYQALLGKGERTEEEQRRLRRLEEEMEEFIPPSLENPILRYAQELVQEVILGETAVDLKRKAGMLADALTRQRARKAQA
jgi:hypothetical protein